MYPYARGVAVRACRKVCPRDKTMAPPSIRFPGRVPVSTHKSASWFEPDIGSARLAAIRLLDLAHESGAAAAEVFALRTDARRLEGDVETTREDVGYRALVRVWTPSGAMGQSIIVTDALDRSVRKDLVDTALADARPTKGTAGPPPRLDIPDRGLDIADRRYPALDDLQRREVLRANVDGCLQVDSRIGEVRLRYEELHETRAFASSAGVEAAETGTRFALIGHAATHDGSHKVRGQLVSRNFAEVASRPLGHELGTRLVACLSPADLPSQPTAVVFDQRAVASLLPRLVSAFSAERITAGQSFLHGRVGSRIGSAVLHVVDDARRAGGMATRGFDERGVAPISVNLIKEGRAAGLYQGPDAARLSESRPSGHERADGSLWPGNLVVRPGSRSRNMLFPEMGTFVIIEEITDSSGIDPNTGTIDIGVLCMVATAAGPIGCAGVHRLRCTAESLFSSVIHVCNDQQRHGIVDTATWICDGIWLS